jgi:hypothetical protein
VDAAHRLHVVGGLSIRELGRQLYRRFGYSSDKSCAMALSTAFHRHGLPTRDRIEAAIAASTTHGRASRGEKNAYRRWRRRQVRHGLAAPWPSNVKPRGTRPRCNGETVVGERCRGRAMAGSTVCAVHAGLAHSARYGWHGWTTPNAAAA